MELSAKPAEYHLWRAEFVVHWWCCAFKITTSGGTRTHNPRLRRPVPYPLGHRGLPELHRVMVVVISIEKYEKILAQEKFRGHPGLNQGPLDLQSNALPLSYIPFGKTRFPIGISDLTKNPFSTCAHVRP